MSIFNPEPGDLEAYEIGALKSENDTLKKRVKELEELTATFDTRGLARLYQSQERLEKENQAFKIALQRISSEKSCVESQSTGMKQYFKTQGAQIAENALLEAKKETP